ncbi:MAG TPA: DUF6448 family protein [Anaerolineae bacterium]|nr:DUF6448 family protein [Anaerolineae bacterium]
MPPHCDSMDGPVVIACRKALEAENVDLILPYVPKQGEEEVVRAFKKVLSVRKQPNGAREIADLYFFETVVRVHRAGEGAPYTGLKPAGLSEGPVIPVAEKAIETGSPDDLLKVLTDIVRAEAQKRFDRAMRLRKHADGPVDEAREYVEAMLGLQVWAHKLYTCARSEPHAEVREHEEVHNHG